IIVSANAVLAGTVIAYVFHHRLLHWITRPLPEGHRRLLTLTVTEPFTTSFKLSFVAGFALALPIVLWQLWAFLAPAVEPKVQRSLRGLTVFAAALLAVGIEFGYPIPLPAALRFFVHYYAIQDKIRIRGADYLSFAILVLEACGAGFE